MKLLDLLRHGEMKRIEERLVSGAILEHWKQHFLLGWRVFGKENDEPLLSGTFPGGPNGGMDIFFPMEEAEANGLDGRFGSGIVGRIMEVAKEGEIGSDT